MHTIRTAISLNLRLFRFSVELEIKRKHKLKKSKYLIETTTRNRTIIIIHSLNNTEDSFCLFSFSFQNIPWKENFN